MTDIHSIAEFPSAVVETPLNPAWFDHGLNGEISDIDLMDSLNTLSQRLRAIGNLMVAVEPITDEDDNGIDITRSTVCHLGVLLDDTGRELRQLVDSWKEHRRAKK